MLTCFDNNNVKSFAVARDSQFAPTCGHWNLEYTANK